MTENQWQAFCAFREDFKAQCAAWDAEYKEILYPLERWAREKDTPAYIIENPIVYNTALDELDESADIRVILVGDNPGKNEQLDINKKYLVGQSGKIGAGFFEKNGEFGLSFPANFIVLNKSPVHSAKTKHLKMMSKESKKAAEVILESQLYMAQKTAELHQAMNKDKDVELWLVGYAEIVHNGVFEAYRNELKACYETCPKEWEKVFAFQHFSMNRFQIDFNSHYTAGEDKNVSLRILGKQHKEKLFV